jgi:hypothetical protein
MGGSIDISAGLVPRASFTPTPAPAAGPGAPSQMPAVAPIDLSAGLIPKVSGKTGGTDDKKPSILDSIQHGAGEFVNDLYQTGKGLATMVAKPPGTPGEIASEALGPIGLPLKRGIEGYYDAVRHHLDAAEAASRSGDAAGALMHSVSAGLPLVGPLIGDVYDKANSGDLAGAIGLGASRIAQAASMAPEGSAIPNPLDIATRAIAKIPAARPSPGALSLGPSAATLDVRPGAGQFQPALDNAPREVLNYAASKGINLTPGEAAPRSPVANTVQAIGERSILGGGKLAEARDLESQKLRQNVADFADRMDPHRMGTSDAEAGDHIQRDAQVAMQVAKENANQAYGAAGLEQQNLAGDVSGLTKWTDSLKNVSQPGAAVARPVYQAPAVQAALADIASKPEALGPNPSIESMRNLRSEFWDKGNDYSGNIPDSARALYKQAAGKVDDYIMDAAKGTRFEPAFRDANAQWKALQEKYNTPGAPLTRILQQSDPAKITNDLLNRASAKDIQTMQGENMDGALQALRRQVVVDVANKGFRITGDGLGGYSDGFLNQLFGRAAVKELYLNSEIARRMGFQVNPSGTSNVLLGMEQMRGMAPSRWMLPLGAAKVSMPRPAASYVPAGPPAVPSPVPAAGRLAPYVRLLLAAGQGEKK